MHESTISMLVEELERLEMHRKNFLCGLIVRICHNSAYCMSPMLSARSIADWVISIQCSHFTA
uniref:Uncharacterized protein n=1 Tax=Arundo donax TaxID=35708 RepID=A0A0A8YB07_ARUDO